MELTYKTTTIGLTAYLYMSTNNSLLYLVQQHENKKKLYYIPKEAARFKKELDLKEMLPEGNETTVVYAKRIKTAAKYQGLQQMQTRLEEKALHGKYPQGIKDADVDMKTTNQWLKSTGLKVETEGLILAAQDQTLPTRVYHHHIIKDGTDPLCCICNKSQETIDHIISGCPELAKPEYIHVHQHNKVAAYVHWKIYKEYEVDTADKWYEINPKTVARGKG